MSPIILDSTLYDWLGFLTDCFTDSSICGLNPARLIETLFQLREENSLRMRQISKLERGAEKPDDIRQLLKFLMDDGLVERFDHAPRMYIDSRYRLTEKGKMLLAESSAVFTTGVVTLVKMGDFHLEQSVLREFIEKYMDYLAKKYPLVGEGKMSLIVQEVKGIFMMDNEQVSDDSSQEKDATPKKPLLKDMRQNVEVTRERYETARMAVQLLQNRAERLEKEYLDAVAAVKEREELVKKKQ